MSVPFWIQLRTDVRLVRRFMSKSFNDFVNDDLPYPSTECYSLREYIIKAQSAGVAYASIAADIGVPSSTFSAWVNIKTNANKDVQIHTISNSGFPPLRILVTVTKHRRSSAVSADADRSTTIGKPSITQNWR